MRLVDASTTPDHTRTLTATRVPDSSALALPNVPNRTVSRPVMRSTSPLPAAIASPTRIPVTASSPIRVVNVACRSRVDSARLWGAGSGRAVPGCTRLNHHEHKAGRSGAENKR